jgi:DNA uptake protein ComE-like DNA-binding protein
MLMKHVAAIAVSALLTTAGAFAQTAPTTTAPAAPMTSAPAMTAPSTSAPTMAPPATTAPSTAATTPAHPHKAHKASTASTLPAGTKVNLNTATPEQLDQLPSIGKGRAKAIVTERAKGPFKNWSDFDTRMAHSSVNAGVKSKIKDYVTF